MGNNTTWLNRVEKLTTAERDAATDGDITFIYNTTKGVYEFYNGSEWVSMTQSAMSNEPSGSEPIKNIVKISQADYEAGTPQENTFYIITDA